MRLVYPAWQKAISDEHLKVGSAYRLAKDRGIQVPEVEHSSMNDVEAIRALLQGTFTPATVIYSSYISPDAKIQKRPDYSKKKTLVGSTPSNQIVNSLIYDADKKLLHSKDCPKVKGITIGQGFDSYKSCIQKGFKPCKCCRDEYWHSNWILSQEIINKCNFNYVYAFHGTLFHRTSCVHARRILYSDLRGSVYYNNCLEKGLKPCGWCKPTIRQQVNPPHIYTQQPGTKQIKRTIGSTWLATRKLTKDEKIALKRHEAARKERERLINNHQQKTREELRDEHVLTQTGYAFWSAIGYQTFHLRKCAKLDHISGLRGYARYNDAIRAGLTPCRLCKPSSKYDIKVSVPIYQKERQGESAETLNRLCESEGYKHRYETPDYYIETPVGQWRLDTRTQPVDVYHINLVKSSGKQFYHKQHRLFLSLTDTFEYIRRHDSNLLAKASKSLKNKV